MSDSPESRQNQEQRPSRSLLSSPLVGLALRSAEAAEVFSLVYGFVERNIAVGGVSAALLVITGAADAWIQYRTSTVKREENQRRNQRDLQREVRIVTGAYEEKEFSVTIARETAKTMRLYDPLHLPKEQTRFFHSALAGAIIDARMELTQREITKRQEPTTLSEMSAEIAQAALTIEQEEEILINTISASSATRLRTIARHMAPVVVKLLSAAIPDHVLYLDPPVNMQDPTEIAKRIQALHVIRLLAQQVSGPVSETPAETVLKIIRENPPVNE